MIDLKELAVVGNTVPTKRYTAIVPPLEQDSSDWAAQPYSNMIESYKPGKAARSSSTYVPTTFTQQVAAFGRDSGIGIGRGTTGGLVRYEPPSFSLIHVMEYQMEMLQTLRKQLMESEALDLRRELETKILTVLGLPAIPSPESSTIMPFVTFDEGGKFHITFLYDDPPFTFWSTILRQHFGIQYMSLQKEASTSHVSCIRVVLTCHCINRSTL